VINLQTIAVVIPAYRVADHILDVLSSIPEIVDHIIVVDDACPEGSGRKAESVKRKGLVVVYHEQNKGVGGAVVTGYKKALKLGCEIVIKMDGDGQMDPSYIERLADPLVRDDADYAKGNRFRDFTALKSMPQGRLFGNSALSFLVKIASGYWDIMDPTNGYTAIHKRVLAELNLDKVTERYFFETDMLINLNIVSAVVKDVSMPARYGQETSSLKVRRALFHFPPKLLRGLAKRVFLKYFIYDFNMASLYLLLGLPTFLISSCVGMVEWLDSFITGTPRSAGTIMLVALPIIISFQMLLQAIQIDISSVPRKK
jgi:glycosyltransferase involved in cell wall biosynthesis